jgi:hypothetical protein
MNEYFTERIARQQIADRLRGAREPRLRHRR